MRPILLVLTITAALLIALPASAGAAIGQSPFTQVQPAQGSVTTKVRLRFQWGGRCPAGHECRLKLEATQKANPPRMATGEFERYQLDGSYLSSTLGTAGAMGPGSTNVTSAFERAGVWFYQLVSWDEYEDAEGHTVTEVHTTPLKRFTIRGIARNHTLKVTANSPTSRYMTWSTSMIGNVNEYDLLISVKAQRRINGRLVWVSVFSDETYLRTYVKNTSGAQSAKGTNALTWQVPNRSWLRSGTPIRVTSKVRPDGIRAWTSSKTRVMSLFVTQS